MQTATTNIIYELRMVLKNKIYLTFRMLQQSLEAGWGLICFASHGFKFAYIHESRKTF